MTPAIRDDYPDCDQCGCKCGCAGHRHARYPEYLTTFGGMYCIECEEVDYHALT